MLGGFGEFGEFVYLIATACRIADAIIRPATKSRRFGEMRSSGVRDVLVYRRDHYCSHHIRIAACFWPDHLRLSDIEDRFVCRVFGKRGADIRPDFPQGRMGTG
jgi:hypothetical protein